MKKVILENKNIRNTLIMILILIIVTIFSFLVVEIGGNNYSVTALYVMAVVIISILCDEYIYGIVTSLLGVIGINYFFMYPYWAFDFSLSGYPLTIVILIIISIISSYMPKRYIRLKQARNKLEMEKEQEKIEGDLLRSLSHDLRTPLTSILSAISLLESESKLDEKTKEKLLHDIQVNAHWQLDMVENLLSITRIQNEGDKVLKQEELVIELIETVLAREKRLHFDITFDVKLTKEVLLVLINETLMEQVLQNLIENAYKYGDKNKPIEILAKKEKESIIIEVRDHGKGIKESIMPLLFTNELMQKEGNRKDGFGMGLYLCASIMKVHNGSIHCRNMEDGGACFTLSLPIVKEEENLYE